MLSLALVGELIQLPMLLLCSVGAFFQARGKHSSGLLRIQVFGFIALSSVSVSLLIAAEPKTNVSEGASRPALQAPLADAAEARNWLLLTKLLSQDMDIDQSQADGMTALHWAVYHNNSEAVANLLRRKANVNAATRYQVTPLAIACTQTQTSSLKLLLEAGADVEFRSPGGETPLMIASRTGNAESVKQLLAYKVSHQATDRNDQTALMWAASAGNLDVVDVLLQAGVDLDAATSFGLTAMMFAARDGRIEVVRRLIAAGVDVNAVIDSTKKGERVARDKTSALVFAVESGHYELAMELISAGADPNDQRNGFTCLHVVSWVRKPNSGDDANGDPPPRGSGNLSDLEFVRAIVAAGADVNARLKSGFGGRAILNPRGAAPLLYAARTADVPLMKVLVELGADPLVPNSEGTTPLMAAAGVGVRAVNEEAGTEPEVVEAIDYLVSLGADVNTIDENQETAIHGAAYRNFPRVVDRLAYHGADPKSWNHKNKSGWTPIMIAEGQRPGSFKPSPETVAALRAAMTERE
ncbi:MAG: ankyrin repeat domain-containing protein [Planctomycetota bacterium]|nr:ankyrin repeat domain-containing protein [Planctomycetota bacterium]